MKKSDVISTLTQTQLEQLVADLTADLAAMAVEDIDYDANRAIFEQTLEKAKARLDALKGSNNLENRSLTNPPDGV